MLIMALMWHVGLAGHIQYLDQYADPTPFLMKHGFIQYRDCYTVDVNRDTIASKTGTLRVDSVEFVACAIVVNEGGYHRDYHTFITTHYDVACDNCRDPCQFHHSNMQKQHICPHYIKSRDSSKLGYKTASEDWDFPYRNVCANNGTMHQGKTTGTLCDFPFTNISLGHWMIAANNCSVGFKIFIKDVAISVAQTLYTMQSAFPVQMSITTLGSSLLPSSLKIEILDISSGDTPERNVVNGTTEERTITKPTNIPLHVEKLDVRSEPYKVVIVGDKEIVKHWFYLHLVTTTRVTILVSKSGNTERNVACLTDDELNRRTQQNVESMDGPHLYMKKPTSETYENVTNPVIIHESAEFQCIAIVKSKTSCFPYHQAGQEFKLMSDTRVTVEECWLHASEIGPIVGIIVLLLIFAAILVGLLINTRRQLKRYIRRLDLRSESTGRIPKENEHTAETKMDTSTSKGLTKGDSNFGVDGIENSSSPLVFADMQIVDDDAFVS